MLGQNKGIDIVCFMTSAEREAAFLPIRIPVDKGLIGWRLLLISKVKARYAEGWTNIEQLKRLRAGQGSDWPDTEILRSNGFLVHGTSNYEGLFSMLSQGRIDYFPRSVNEVWNEADAHSDQLEVEPSVVLRYPSASYFFVRKGNDKLAVDVTAGLEKMIADGSFDKLFYEYYGDILKRSSLKDRRVIELRNPLLPDGVPAGRQHLMHRE
jgi:membrane-bound lytic murein transglycosylase MltF